MELQEEKRLATCLGGKRITPIDRKSEGARGMQQTRYWLSKDDVSPLEERKLKFQSPRIGNKRIKVIFFHHCFILNKSDKQVLEKYNLPIGSAC